MRASSTVRFGWSVGGWVSDCLAICHFLHVLCIWWQLEIPTRGISIPTLARRHRGISQRKEFVLRGIPIPTEPGGNPISRQEKMIWRLSPFPARVVRNESSQPIVEQGEKWTQAHDESLQPRPVRFVCRWVSVGMAICHFLNVLCICWQLESPFVASRFPPWQEDIAASGNRGKSSNCAAFPLPMDLAAFPYLGERRRSGGFPLSQQQ